MMLFSDDLHLSGDPIGDHTAILTRAATLAPHLSWLFKRHHDDLTTIINHGHDAIIADADIALTTAISAAIAAASDDASLMAAIRHYRSRINHLVAVTDLLNLASVTSHMNWLTHAAEHALNTLTSHLAGDNNTDWFMLALGKMGAGELNYSSDIDLIIITLIDPDDYDRAQQFIRLTRRMIAIMSTPTADGIGWRIDLRLRPDPGATPIAIQYDAAISYYESMARTWERAAFIRARPVAGNIEAGDQFLSDLTPFVWRRYLDYTVLDDLKVMLRREPRTPDLLGYNIKNGYGGIRSIEFFVHAQQLIAGGREQGLRHRITNDALDALAANRWITNTAATRLKSAYLTWRRLEHRIQMMGDAQTHSLPKSPDALGDVAHLCGVNDAATFTQLITELGDAVHADTNPLMDRLDQHKDTSSQHQDPDHHQPDHHQIDLNPGDDLPQHTLATLQDLGYTYPETVLMTCQGWLAGRIPATRSPRSCDVLTTLLPGLLYKLADTGTPDQSFAAFARLVEKLPAGLQLFSLMDTHDDIAATIIGMVTAAPKIADIISGHPILADSLLYRSFWATEQDWPARLDELTAALNAVDDYEEHLLMLRRYCREWQFRISAQLLQGVISPSRAGRDYAAIADAIIHGVMMVTTRDITRRFGTVNGGSIAVLALGRLGAQEMTLLSDLDLIFIYDGPIDARSTSSDKSITISQYYTRFGQGLINALSALTAEGKCYDIDMRLRPSGNKGPVSVHLDTFTQYQQQDAWTWEHMALIKSRIICHHSSPDAARDLPAVLKDFIPTVIKSNRDPARLASDVQAMRERLTTSQSSTGGGANILDLRSSPGGIMDLDFLTQMLQMMPQAAAIPLTPRAADAAPLLMAADVITPADADAITTAANTYFDAIQLMRLLDMSPKDNISQSDHLPALLKKRFNINTFREFSAYLKDVYAPISSLMKKCVSKAEKRE